MDAIRFGAQGPREKKLQTGLRLFRLRLGVESEFLSLIRIWARLGYCLGTQITHMVIIYVYIWAVCTSYGPVWGPPGVMPITE